MDHETEKYAVTHDGKFHADDVFAAAMLPYCGFGEMRLIRMRPDSETNKRGMENAFIVFDVGMEYSHEKRRYDHHMRADYPIRADGQKYSSAGLLFFHYGKTIVREMLNHFEPMWMMHFDITDEAVDFMYKEIHDHFMLHIDNVDNGDKKIGSSDICAVIGDFNLLNFGFEAAQDFARQVLKLKMLKLVNTYVSKEKVLAAARNLYADHILVMDEGMPYQRVVFEEGLDQVLLAVFPSDGQWRVGTIPIEPGSMQNRVSLLDDWGGLENEKLVAACGIEDAIFVHKALFTGGAKSKEGALKMAELALTAYLLSPQYTYISLKK